jgi:polyphosphate glucokinase
LVIDIGGTKVKFLASGQTEPRKMASGKSFTPGKLVERIRALTSDWTYEAISIGYPGLVGNLGPRSEAGNLGPGWVGFDFASAFERPVKICNDAALQAIGSYEGGRMLFLGLGTGLGSALIADHVIVSLELGQIASVNGQTFGNVVGRAGLKRLGKDVWRKEVDQMVTTFINAFVPDYTVIGGGNARKIKVLPPGTRLGNNLTAFRGGFRIWNLDDVPQLVGNGTPTKQVPQRPITWRMV